MFWFGCLSWWLPGTGTDGLAGLGLLFPAVLPWRSQGPLVPPAPPTDSCAASPSEQQPLGTTRKTLLYNSHDTAFHSRCLVPHKCTKSRVYQHVLCPDPADSVQPRHRLSSVWRLHCKPICYCIRRSERLTGELTKLPCLTSWKWGFYGIVHNESLSIITYDNRPEVCGGVCLCGVPAVFRMFLGVSLPLDMPLLPAATHPPSRSSPGWHRNRFPLSRKLE